MKECWLSVGSDEGEDAHGPYSGRVWSYSQDRLGGRPIVRRTTIRESGDLRPAGAARGGDIIISVALAPGWSMLHHTIEPVWSQMTAAVCENRAPAGSPPARTPANPTTT